jgi:hypothetical protein
VAFWTLLPIIAVSVGLLSSDVARVGGEEVALPLWFLAVYLVAVSCVPAIHALHRRLGAWALVALAAAAFVIDNLRFGLDVPNVGALNYLLVWGAVLELGFLWADGTLRRRWLQWAMASGGLATVGILVGFFDFPVSMIDLTHGSRTNCSRHRSRCSRWRCGSGRDAPFEDAGNRWLQGRRGVAERDRPQLDGRDLLPVEHERGRAAAVLLFPTGIAPQPEPLSTAWWLLRPAWWLACAICIVPFMLAFRWAERPVPVAPSSLRRRLALTLAVTGTAAAAVGLGMLAANAFPVPDEELRLPAFGVAAVIAGGLLLRVDPIAPLRRR